MKTTIDVGDGLFSQLKASVHGHNTTMRAVIERALRDLFAKEAQGPKKPFVLKDGSFGGSGYVEGINEGDWDKIREIIYEGRGT